MSRSLTRRSIGLLGLMAAATPAFAAGSPDAAFADFSKRYIDDIARQAPITATGLGDHRFDHELTDLSAKGRAKRLASARRMLKEADKFKADQLSRENQVDLALVKNQLRYDIWTDQVLQSWAWDPQIYNGAAGSALYTLMAREFAPLSTRLQSAMARMEKLPKLLAQTRAELVPARVPRIHAETVAKQNAGVMSIVDTMITPHYLELAPLDQARLKRAADALRSAMVDHQEWLDKTLLPAAKGDFRIGAKLYDEKLAFALMSQLTRATIRTRAEASLKSARAEMYAISVKLLGGPAGNEQQTIEKALERAYVDHAPRTDLVKEATASLAQATAFVRAKDLITLPSGPVKVIDMPEFQRGVSVAYCDSPGPLEKSLATFYAISPIPDEWTPAQAESFLREYNRRGVQDICIHEAMPGHYVQIFHANSHPSVLRAVLGSGAFIEGWACYAEDRMALEGYMDHDPLFRLQQLKTRVRTITNAILDQMVHVDGASEAQVMTFLTVTAFQQEREAAGKWTRARLDSTQLPSYFVGVSEHDALRAEMQAKLGRAFTEKGYHDKVLSYGSPPVRFARAMMLDLPI
ncbi:DUF885 domain-containing protein [soil metagenome]